MRYKTIFSDAGDIIIDTRTQLETEKKVLSKLMNLDPKEAYRLYRPFRQQSHTLKSIEECFDEFSELHNIGIDYIKFCDIVDSLKPKTRLYDGVVETLVALNNYGIDFILLTDSPYTKRESFEMTKREIESYLLNKKSNLVDNIIFENYVKDIITSKEIGVKKTNPYFFRFVFEKLYPEKNISESVFVTHKYKEMISAMNCGIDIIALNWENEEDSGDIMRLINDGCATHINTFGDLCEE